MIIQCSSCQTRFKLADEKMKPQGVKVRCTHCNEVFTVLPPAAPKPAPPQPEPPAAPAATSQQPSKPAVDFSEVRFDDEDTAARDEDNFDLDEFNLEGLDDDQPLPAEPDAEEFAAPQGVREVVPGDLPPLEDFDLDDEFAGFDSESSDDQEPSEEPAEEPAIGGDLGIMFEDESPTENLPQLDEEVSLGPQEFSFDESPDEPLAESDTGLSGGPVEFSFDEPAEEEAEEPPADNFFFEEEPPAASTDEAFAGVQFEMPKPAAEVATPEPAVAADIATPAKPAPSPQPQPSRSTPASAAVRPRQRRSPARKRRKKSNSRGALLMLLLLLVLGGGYAWYGWQQNTYDPAILIEHLRAQLPGLKKTAPQGTVEIRNLTSMFIDNQNAGQLFVINGEVVNRYPDDRSAISVKGVLYNQQGKAVLQQTVFCGNPLDEAALRTLPYSKIEESMNNQFGDALSNLNLAPNQAIPFTVVFRHLPAQISEFNVELADSRPGTK